MTREDIISRAVASMPAHARASSRLRQLYVHEALLASEVRQIVEEHGDRFAAFMETHDEEPWDEYIERLGRAWLDLKRAKHARVQWASAGCEGPVPFDDACDCYACETERIAEAGAESLRDQHHTARACIRAGQTLHARLLMAAFDRSYR